MNESQVAVPLQVRLQFGHAAVQRVADVDGIDLLHIKGAAVAPALRPEGYLGSDVDVLVRPDQVDAIDAALREHGWTLYSTFEHGSPFGHAQTYVHDAWGYIDIHRRFPGIRLRPDLAFDVLWRDRHATDIAGVTCQVPSEPAQGVILVLNAARSAKGARGDVVTVWKEADADRRVAIERLVERLHAEVAFAAAAGGLERFRHDREYRLWKVVSEGGSRSAEWWARIRSAPTTWAGVRIALRAPLVNVDHLAHRLGRTPTPFDVSVEFVRRPFAAVFEGLKGAVRRVRPRRVVR